MVAYQPLIFPCTSLLGWQLLPTPPHPAPLKPDRLIPGLMDRTLYKPGTLSVRYSNPSLFITLWRIEKLCLFRTLGRVVFNVAFLFGLATVLQTPGYYLLFFHSVVNSWLLFTLLPPCCQLLAIIYSFATVLPTPGYYLLFGHSVANSWILFTLWQQCC